MSFVMYFDPCEQLLKIEHNFWFDQHGKFYFRTSDIYKADINDKNYNKIDHSGYMLEWGKNIISLTKLHSGFIKLSTIGLSLFHSKLIDIINKENIEKTYFINRVKHMSGPNQRGSRTTLWLEEVN